MAQEVVLSHRGFLNAPECGDQGDWWQRRGQMLFALADGLGHGPEAEKAARAALAYIDQNLDADLPKLLSGCDSAIRQTRGVALAVARVDLEAETLTFAGIGNVWGLIRSERQIHLRSDYGIIGAGYRNLRQKIVRLHPGDIFLMATDGIAERFVREGAPELEREGLQVIGDNIISRWGRETDDAAVLLYRFRKERQ